jgi:hypothetical protein
MAVTFTTRAQGAARSSGIAARTHRTAPITPWSNVAVHAASLRSSKRPAPAGVDQHVERTPPRIDRREDVVDVGRRGQICAQCQHLRTAGGRQRRGGLRQPGFVPADDGYPRAVLGQAHGGRQSDATGAARDYHGGIGESQIHDRYFGANRWPASRRIATPLSI